MISNYIYVDFRRKLASINKATAMTQEEIVSSTKTVAQGLEALRSEHQSILQGLNGSLKAAAQEKLDSNVIEEKANLIKKSLDMIELGLGEAQVKASQTSHRFYIYQTINILVLYYLYYC